MHLTPNLDLSEDVFPTGGAPTDTVASADAVELTDEPAPESDAAAEVELETESVASADGAAGDDELAPEPAPPAQAEVQRGDEPDEVPV